MPNIPTRNNNPGDLKDPATGSFRQFKSSDEGFQALQNDILGKMTGNTKTGLNANSTLKDFAYTWAPPTDNNDSEGYAKKLASQLGVTPETPIGSLKSRISDFAKAVASNEGFKGGVAYADEVPQKPRLTHQQLTANIDAMEKQGAQPQEVQAYLDSLKQGQPQQGAAPQQQAPQAQENLGTQLAQRLSNISTALSDQASGKQGVASAALQSVGQVAGGVGDVVNTGLRGIPGVSVLEDGLNKVIGGLAGTATGQSIVQAFSDLEKANPVAAKNIGAVLNIASVFPMFKGVGLLASAGKDAAASVLESRLESAATKELTDVAGKTIAGRKLVQDATARGLNPIATIIGKTGSRFAPDVSIAANGDEILSTSEGYANAKTALDHDEELMQQMLKNAHSDVGISLESVQKEAVALARKDGYGLLNTKDLITKQMPKEFENLKYSIGGKTYVDVKDLNDLKRTVRHGLNWKSEKLQEDAAYYMSKAMMNRVEKEAETMGIKGVKELNRKMASKIEAMKLLKHLEGKVIKRASSGYIKEGVTDAMGGVGEAIGNSTGVPFAGALAGRGLARLIPKGGGGAISRLARTGSRSGIAGKLKSGLLRTASPGLLQAQKTP